MAKILSKETDTSTYKESKNLYGQKMGRKGAETRARLLKATANLIEKRSIMDLSVAEIAAVAGTSSAAFYVYFDDVTEVALALAQSVEQVTPEIENLLSHVWTPENASANGLLLVNAYVALWQQHHAILRLRNLRADEGEKRFEKIRHESVEHIHLLLSSRIEQANNGLEPAPGASAVLVLLERIAVMANLPLRRKHASRSQLIKAVSYLVAEALTPHVKPNKATALKSPPKTPPKK